MPNPYQYQTLTLEQSAATQKQLEPLKDYLGRFVARLRKMNLQETDPLLVAAVQAQKGVTDLSFAVFACVKKPRKTKWE